MLLFKSPIVKPENVRVATIADETRLFALLKRLHEDNPNPGNLPVSDERVWAHVNAACRGEKGVAGVVDGPDGDLIASVGIFLANPWWTEAWHLSQYWMFVDPPHRKGGRVYRDLLQFSRWHRADISARSGYQMALENSFITKQDIMGRFRLWRKTGRCIGAIFWVEG